MCVTVHHSRIVILISLTINLCYTYIETHTSELSRTGLIEQVAAKTRRWLVCAYGLQEHNIVGDTSNFKFTTLILLHLCTLVMHMLDILHSGSSDNIQCLR